MSALEDLKKKLATDEVVYLSALDALEVDMIRLTAKGEEPCSLAKDPGHPGNNWVSQEGGLPTYVCNVAKHIDAPTTGQKIAEAISQIKKWIADPKTTPETKAKATAAIADWERMKAGAHAHATVKAAAKLAK